MIDLADFLLARIAEDEAVARDAIGWNEGVTDWADDGEPDWIHIARHDPSRVLAECEAKRRIVERYAQHRDKEPLRILALPYADHQDYREEWRP